MKSSSTTPPPSADDVPEYKRWARDEWAKLGGNEKDVLIALCKHGPLWDGDVPSKSGRDGLVDKGFAARIVLKGPKYGYQAATARGANVYKWGFIEPRKDVVRELLGKFKDWVKP
jgi:hypothetical protein